ncbi:MAG: hypothetical protein IJD95_05580 [Clostridia bacterium]|nr:hypothetical protein [Clostridia bacterium]MBR2327993.1 hypothetical protein [Clostridia bacterium]
MKEKSNKNNEEKRLKEIDRQEYRERKKKSGNAGYLIKLFIIVFILTVVFSFFSNIAIEGAGTVVSIIIIAVIAVIGILFDIVGVSVTSADISPFNAMASRKIKGAKRGASLIKNADKVSSICNDVIGDMSGIISGSAGTALSVRLASVFENQIMQFVFPLLVTAAISTFVIAGKAAGKSFAIKHSNETVFFVAKFITFFRREK